MKKELKNLSFRTKLIAAFGLIFIVTVLSLGYFVWKELNLEAREVSRQKLISIARTTAALIDVDEHDSIESDSQKEYQNIHNFLEKIDQANPMVDSVYTMEKTDRENIWKFIVDGENLQDKNGDGEIEEEEEPAAFGEEYDVTDFPEMKAAFSGPTADREINCDKWGCWLSGYAPIMDSNGNSVAIVGVDISADDILSFENQTRKIILLFIVITTFSFIVTLYVFLHFLVRPVYKIVEGMRNFSRNFSERLKIDSEDEFELIANTFNKMADELQELYRNLEEKVKEKTQKLADKFQEVELGKAKDEAILESIGEGMIAVDEKGKIVMANHRAEIIMGVEKIQMLGKSFKEAVDMRYEDNDKVEDDKRPIRLSLQEKRRIVSSDLYLVRSDGSKFPVLITSAPVVFNGKTIGAIILFRDITEEKRIDRAKSEFVSLASHQLQTPLASINWYAEMLMDGDVGKLSKKQLVYMGKIFKSNRRMTNLVISLLNVSRIELGTFMIEVEPTDVSKLLDNILEDLEKRILDKKLRIKKDYSDKLPKFPADPRLLRIVLENLISNATKYTPPKGTVTVRASVVKANEDEVFEKLVFEIIDTGYGIPKDDQSKIFTRLFRSDNVKVQEPEGTGLGLYISKSIVESSGGEIGFSSEENKGTTFRVSFPETGMKSKEGTKKLD